MIKEGHHTVVNIQADYDTDHGPCTIYRLQDGNSIVLYPEDRSRVSVHIGDDHE